MSAIQSQLPTQNLQERFENLTHGERIVDTRDHLEFFRSVAKGEVLEIGVHSGNSTTAFLLGIQENGGHLTSVDILDYSQTFSDSSWTFLCTDSRKLPECFLPEEFDVIYIDGEHTYEGATSDLNFAHKRIKEGGTILMHDVSCPAFPGVVKAFNESYVKHPDRKHTIREGSWGLGVIEC